MDYQWNWAIFSQETAMGDGSTYWGWMLAGLKMTLTISLSAWLLALVLAYSVRLANDGIWDSETGVNDLGMQLTVE